MHPFKIVPLAIALSLLSGCASHKPPPRPGSIHAKVEQLSEMSYLQITDLRAVKRNHLLTVQAEINNTDSDNQQLYYRFKWLDANGFTVGSEEAWKPVLVYAYQKQTLTAVAPSPQATDFRLVVQSPDNTGDLP
ncbi:YcfL family protein [Methylobacter sp. Wu8]|uniref:YcfL family protein n=1 Tax=Methylobacter sp. Wu8 TaxID=3118457 RepID=UPI002F330034